jgi:hypothetical protein
MSVFTNVEPSKLVGFEYDRLSYEQRAALAGKWIAMEVYSPKTTPLRNIEAVGDSAEDCARQLLSRGLAPAKFEFSQVTPPY